MLNEYLPINTRFHSSSLVWLIPKALNYLFIGGTYYLSIRYLMQIYIPMYVPCGIDLSSLY